MKNQRILKQKVFNNLNLSSYTNKSLINSVFEFITSKVIIVVVVLLVSFAASNQAKADLVEDLIKKHKLDPKNNSKDQCNLMNELSKKTSRANGGVCKNNDSFCCDKHNNICEASVKLPMRLIMMSRSLVMQLQRIIQHHMLIIRHIFFH